ncbi:MAG: DUF721 domain-containing protein, partial [Marinicaulis sp.]|nr:DUF721 domain-containing protein [Marinicaulis sp.]
MVFSALARKTKYADPMLAENWPTIAGAKIGALCRPGRILGTKGKSPGYGRSLEVYPPSGAAAAELQMHLDDLIVRVNRFLGPGAISRITLIQAAGSGVLPRWLKVHQALDFVQAIHPGFSREKAEQLLSATDIPKNKKVKQLSKGMVTQLHLALVLAIQVDLLVLDEPTLGLDILHRKEFYDRLLNECADNKTSIIISTHQVEEIEHFLITTVDTGIHLQTSSMGPMEALCGYLNDKKISIATKGLGPVNKKDIIRV